MNTKKINIRTSFVWLCLGHFVLYSLILGFIYVCFSFYTSSKINNIYISTSNILEYEDLLEDDDFAHIPAKITKHCSFIVFDEEGACIYSSSNKIREIITFDMLDYICEYGDSKWYSVSENITVENKRNYIIQYKDYDQFGNQIVISSCVLDSDYNIVRGKLFGDKKYLTEKEFNTIRGAYSKNATTEKYEYETEQGEKRILVSVCPVMSEAKYYETTEKIDRLWLFALPIILIVIFIQPVLLVKNVKKSISQINNAIETYQDNEEFEVDQTKVPSEFLSIVDNFKNLLGWLKNLQLEKEKIYKDSQQMIADISHDLKTPLTVIQGYSKALNEGRVPEEKKAKYLETIYEKSALSSSLIDSLFDCVKMEHPDYKLNLTEVDLSEYITEILAEKYNEIEEHGFELDVDITENKIPFSVDKKLFNRIFENLLGNSLQYNPEKTTIFVSLKEDANNIILTVADDGVGIPKELAENIFKPFVTSNNARSSGKGTGLGLTIASKIVELHNGTIELCKKVSKPSYKTEFKIKFPKKDD